MHDAVVLILLVVNVVLAAVNIYLAIPRTRLAERKLEAWDHEDWDGEL